MENIQLLGLVVQATGATLVGLLSLMLNRVVKSPALKQWVYAWFSLGISLTALLLDQVSPSTAAVTLSCYLLGEYLYGYWLIKGCVALAGKDSRRPKRSLWLVAFGVCATLLPHVLGYEFRKIFLIQAAYLATVFAAAYLWLQVPSAKVLRGSGLFTIRASLLLLAINFFSYLPIVGANVFLHVPLPTGMLIASSAAHLLFEFLLGFGSAVMILEESNRGLMGRNKTLTNQMVKFRGDAERDALTNALNRRSLIERLEGILAEAARTAKSVSLLYLDLDNFKHVNDTYGHALGDQLLIAVARRLEVSVAETDMVVRMGGDEFIVVTVGAQEPQDVAELACRLKSALSETVELSGTAIRAQASIGISTYPIDGATAEALLQNADVALYQAKSSGKNDFRHFDATMKQRDRERALLSQALIEAIGTPQLWVEYQPVVDLASSRIISLEALLRWRHSELGVISPAVFITLAEQGGFIDRLGEFVLTAVCQQIQEWQSKFVPLVPIAVNVSPRQFEQGGLDEIFHRVMAEYNVDPVLIKVEITETELMKNADEHSRTLQLLRRQGIKVCIDDFGTGYSSLSYLKNLPIDCLKIDKSFIAQMTTDDRDAAIVRGVIGIAQSMDMTIVAEGVELPEQAKLLRSLGCLQAQGYLFHRPVPASRCQELLENDTRKPMGLIQCVDEARTGGIAAVR